MKQGESDQKKKRVSKRRVTKEIKRKIVKESECEREKIQIYFFSMEMDNPDTKM